MASFTENVHLIDWLALKGLELLIYLEGVTGVYAADHSTAPHDQRQAETGNGLEAAAAGPSTGSAGHSAGHVALVIAFNMLYYLM